MFLHTENLPTYILLSLLRSESVLAAFQLNLLCMSVQGLFFCTSYSCFKLIQHTPVEETLCSFYPDKAYKEIEIKRKILGEDGLTIENAQSCKDSSAIVPLLPTPVPNPATVYAEGPFFSDFQVPSVLGNSVGQHLELPMVICTCTTPHFGATQHKAVGRELCGKNSSP